MDLPGLGLHCGAMLASWIARCAAPLIPLADRRLPAPAAIARAQERHLRRLVAAMAPLPAGRAWGLDRLPAQGLVEAFRAQVPITTYAEAEPFIDRVAAGERGVMFPGRAASLAQTSGTTRPASAGERYIPQSRALLSHHRSGGMTALARLLRATGGDMFGGRLVMMGGSTDLSANAAGIRTGDLSGIVVAEIPSWLRGLYEPGNDIAFDTDWNRKLARMVERLAFADVRLVSGIGSWMTLLFDGVCAVRRVDGIHQAWPNLRGVIHGGHAVSGVLPQFRRHLSPAVHLIEVYPASEAFLAVGSRPWTLDEADAPELALLCDHGVVLEFLPEDDPRPERAVGPEALEPGRVYRTLLTTPGGLVRYQIGDLALGCGPGRMRFAGRVATRISVFGEHVEGFALSAAVAHACAVCKAEVDHMHVAPILPGPGEPRGAHEWWIEFRLPPANPTLFMERLDEHLRQHVVDYRAHREVQLRMPILRAVPVGTFHAWLAERGKLGGQHKVPQAWNDHSIADALGRLATR